MSKKKKNFSSTKIDNIEEKVNNFYKDDIEDMINEKRKNTKELTKELEKAKEEYNKEIIDEIEITKKHIKKEINEDIDENLGKTQVLELTRQMKFNFENVKSENCQKKNGLTLLNIIGTLNLICIGFYIYLLTFSNYQDNQTNYLIAGSIIVLLVLFFGISVISSKKLRKVFNVFNIITILTFIAFNIYILIY